MRLLLLYSVSLLGLASPTARAQSADDYFNGGAQAYISNNIPQALASVETGLKQYPDDAKLKKLYELLKRQSQESSQNSQSQQNQNSQSQSNPSQPQKSNSPQQSPQPSQQNSQPQNQNQPNPSGQKNDEPPKPAAEKPDGQKPENPDGQGQPVAAGQMTPEAAKRLLDAQKGDEQFLQLKPQGKPRNDQQPIKDW